MLYDEVIAHLLESVVLPQRDTVPTLTRKWASGEETTFLPYAPTEDGVPVMARPGDGHRVHVTGLTHTADGFPTQRPDLAAKATQRLLDKIELNRDRIERNETFDIEDADVVIVAIGIVARAAGGPCRMRSAGLRAGFFRPVTLWPFPEEALREAAAKAKCMLVPEMNAGQLRAGSRADCRAGKSCATQSYRWRANRAGRHRSQGAGDCSMNDLLEAPFDVKDYLRLEMMPHFMCPGCGHGIALRCLLWAVHELGIDKNKLAIVCGIGCSGRVGALSTPIRFIRRTAARWRSPPV